VGCSVSSQEGGEKGEINLLFFELGENGRRGKKGLKDWAVI